MSRSASESSLLVVPGCGTQVPPPQARLKAATPDTAVGPVSVPVPAPQLTANLQKLTADVVILIRKFGEPAGGNTLPSRSAGSRLWCDVLVLAHACLATPPTSICARSSAQTVFPWKLLPL